MIAFQYIPAWQNKKLSTVYHPLNLLKNIFSLACKIQDWEPVLDGETVRKGLREPAILREVGLNEPE